MSRDRPPPPPPACLLRPYPSNQKGGTLVVEDVTDLDAHRRRMSDPDGYRPAICPHCAHEKLHVHGCRERVQRGEFDPAMPSTVEVKCYRCALCRAIWRILPLFLARRLWRRWQVVEAATVGPSPPAAAPQVPMRTAQRWRARLATTALHLVEVLRKGAAELAAPAANWAASMIRSQVIAAYTEAHKLAAGERLARLAGAIHRLAPGIRLM